MARETILVVEDEENILELVSYNLVKEGFQVASALSAEEALEVIHAHIPDLVLLDLMLPGMDGLDLCSRLRKNEKTKNLPIIILTAKGEESDVVKGLDRGADDYITKPFSPRVLTARIRAVLRRRAEEKEKSERGKDVPIEIHDLVIHPGRHEVLVKGKPVALTHSEFNLLYFLASKPGWVFTRYQILDAVHGDDYIVTDRAVDVQIVGLRRKLGSMGKYIETVRGVGYRFRE